MKVIGNAGPSFGAIRSGSGTEMRRVPFGHLTIAGLAGEVIRIPVTDLYPKFDQIFQGISVQAVGNNVQIDTTLAPIDLAMDPAQDASPIWFADTTAVAGHIETLKNMCTAIRITFAADAIVYVAGV